MFRLARRGPTFLPKLLSTSIPRTSAPFALSRFQRSAIQPIFSNVRAFRCIAARRQVAGALVEENDGFEDYAEVDGNVATKFQELADSGLVNPQLINTITKGLGFENMTPVQSQTLNEILKGGDVLAQARTGTGKTLAFLLPVLQNIIAHDPTLADRPTRNERINSTNIRAIVISPTRELAEQIAVEAKKLTRGTRIVVQTATGGSQKNVAMKKMRQEGCHVLVATPGRLKDILTDEYSKVSAPNLSAFVLDEADRLLDQGFVPEIRAIEALMPDRRQVDRQTLMFSATVPREVMSLVNSFMKKDYSFVQTVQKGEVQTHERVPQKLVRVTGLENFMPALLELAKNELVKTDSELPFKAIVYFNASSEATLAHKIFSNLTNPGDTRFGGHPFQSTTLIEMHARLSQNVRSKNAEIFRRSKTAIMFSSDVTARGMDFPNVTHVIQIGVPGTKDTYVHRIGRTARGDKNGEGWLLVSSLEYHETLQRLDDIPLVEDNSLATATIDMKKDAQLPASVAQTLTQIVEATKTVDFATKRAAYKASLGVYAWVSPRQKIVQFMNDRSMYGWGMAQPPGIPVALAKRLGFRTDSGLNLIKSEESRGGGVGESSGGGRGSRSFNFWEGGVRGGRASDFRDGEDRGGRSFGSRDGGDRAPRRSFGGDRPERPSYGSGERRTGSFDRKETRNGYEDRPRRPSGAQGRSSFGGERKSYGAREGGFERGGDRAPRAERSVAKEAY